MYFVLFDTNLASGSWWFLSRHRHLFFLLVFILFNTSFTICVLNHFVINSCVHLFCILIFYQQFFHTYVPDLFLSFNLSITYIVKLLTYFLNCIVVIFKIYYRYIFIHSQTFVVIGFWSMNRGPIFVLYFCFVCLALCFCRIAETCRHQKYACLTYKEFSMIAQGQGLFK